MSIHYLAQQFTIQQPGGAPFSIQGPLKILGSADPNNPKLADLINLVNIFLIPFASIILFLVLVWGGYDYLLSQGDPGKVKGAQAKMTTGIIGFVLLLLAFFITQIFARVFGLGAGIFSPQ